MDRGRIAFVPALTLVLTLAAGCSRAPEATSEDAPERVENAELGIAIADLPENFRVVGVASSKIELELIDGEGRMEIAAGEPETAINLVAAVDEHRNSILARPGGDYKGGRELKVMQLPGAAFYSRGRFEDENGRLTEETVVFLIHPWQDRQLRVTYTYPAGDDSAARLEEQLFPVVEELEGLPRPDEAGTPGS